MRSGIKKSRGGCVRCKRQKVRCDQAKPACGRCSRVGIECPGYSQQLKWSTKYERLPHQIDPSEETSSATAISPPGGLDPVIDDLLSVNVPDIAFSGFMSDFDFDSNTFVEDVISPRSIAPSTPDLCPPDALEASQEPMSVSNDASVAESCQEATHASNTMQLQRSLSDTSTVLTEYYFKEAASLYSVYDSPMNPFRSTVSQLWKSSRLLHCTLQSMSAACLLESFPHLAKIGQDLRQEAITILQCQNVLDHASLLALLMLGGSSSWHDTGNLGLTFFNLARQRLEHMVSTNHLQVDSNNYHFFEEALIYWELLLAYVADDGELRPSCREETSDLNVYFPSRHIPHPWTGVARDTQATVQKVGRLIRRTRGLSRSSQFTTEKSIGYLQLSISRARELEANLLSFIYPDELDIVSPGDRVTPVWHLLTLAEVYRRTGLAQLYRVFPDPLSDRIRVEEDILHDRASEFPESAGTFELGSSSLDDRTKYNEWLTTFVLETLRMLEKIPIESGTRDFQPFLLVASCSELRLSFTQTDTAGPQQHQFPTTSDPSASLQEPMPLSKPVSVQFHSACAADNTAPQLSLRSIEIVRSRQFILDRLTSFLRVLPPKPMRVCMNIAKESWLRIDEIQKMKPSMRARQQDVYWMDIMMDNKWETCMA